jgi:hypothetical protein
MESDKKKDLGASGFQNPFSDTLFGSVQADSPMAQVPQEIQFRILQHATRDEPRTWANLQQTSRTLRDVVRMHSLTPRPVLRNMIGKEETRREDLEDRLRGRNTAAFLAGHEGDHERAAAAREQADLLRPAIREAAEKVAELKRAQGNRNHEPDGSSKDDPPEI